MISEIGRKKIEFILKYGHTDSDGKPYKIISALPSQIEEVNTSLADFSIGAVNVPPIPEDYAEFLMMLDGFEYNGMRFFGTGQVCFDKNYRTKDLYSVNEYFHDMKRGLQDCLVIGEFDDDLFIYSGIDEKYYMVDRDILVKSEEYDSFEQLFITEAGFNLFDTTEPEVEAEFYRIFSE